MFPLYGTPSPPLLPTFISVVNENVSLVISRQLLSDVSTHLALLSDDVSQEVSHFALDVIQPRVISFEEQVSKFMLECEDMALQYL